MAQNPPKKGFFFETLVKLIQESYRDQKNTQIYQRHKLVNPAGRQREFDIVIESNVNSHQILIVIECKDSNKTIPVEKMEAFITKCNRIPSINKKIFVSKHGYQVDAVNAAKESGVILCQLKDIDSSIIQGWVESLDLKKISTFPSITRCFLKFKSGKGIEINSATLYHDVLNQKIVPAALILDVFEKNRSNINSKAMEICNDPINKVPPNSSFGFSVLIDQSKSDLYAKVGNNKIYLDAVGFEMSYKIVTEKLQADVSKSYIKYGNNEKNLDLVSFESVLPNSRFTVIKDPLKGNHLQIMVTNNDGGPLDSIPSFFFPPGLKVTVEENNENQDNK